MPGVGKKIRGWSRKINQLGERKLDDSLAHLVLVFAGFLVMLIGVNILRGPDRFELIDLIVDWPWYGLGLSIFLSGLWLAVAGLSGWVRS